MSLSSASVSDWTTLYRVRNRLIYQLVERQLLLQACTHAANIAEVCRGLPQSIAVFSSVSWTLIVTANASKTASLNIKDLADISSAISRTVCCKQSHVIAYELVDGCR